jgi:hypothetical protein
MSVPSTWILHVHTYIQAVMIDKSDSRIHALWREITNSTSPCPLGYLQPKAGYNLRETIPLSFFLRELVRSTIIDKMLLTGRIAVWGLLLGAAIGCRCFDQDLRLWRISVTFHPCQSGILCLVLMHVNYSLSKQYRTTMGVLSAHRSPCRLTRMSPGVPIGLKSIVIIADRYAQ